MALQLSRTFMALLNLKTYYIWAQYFFSTKGVRDQSCISRFVQRLKTRLTFHWRADAI